jgi:hypothetical protein
VFTWREDWAAVDRSVDAPRPLDADALLEAHRRSPPAPDSQPPRTSAEVTALRARQRTEQRRPPTVGEYVAYADVAYVSARLLTLASEAVHPEALYCVGQTIEKYLKAIWLKKAEQAAPAGTQPAAPITHDLSWLALTLAQTYVDLAAFADPEFIKLCEHLHPFEEAGRYPDHKLDGWGFDPELLTFLDGFVARCKGLLGDLGEPNRMTAIARVLTQPAGHNPVMAAATRAVAENNRHLLGLLRGCPGAAAPFDGSTVDGAPDARAPGV